VNPTRDSTLADPQELIADLRRQLAERDAALAEREVELAETKAERDEALQRETATSEVLGIINTSPGDLVPVFDAMLEKALQLCEAAFGALLVFDGVLVRTAAARNLPPKLHTFLQQPFQPSPEGFFHKAALGKQLSILPTLRRSALERRTIPARQRMSNSALRGRH
jgi:hypothetical protein